MIRILLAPFIAAAVVTGALVLLGVVAAGLVLGALLDGDGAA